MSWTKGTLICDKCKKGFYTLGLYRGKQLCHNCYPKNTFNYNPNKQEKSEMRVLIDQYKEVKENDKQICKKN